MILLVPLLFLMLGGVAGYLHFLAIARDADLLVHGGSSAAIIGMRLGRLTSTLAVMVCAALQGWTALAAATIGFTLARFVVLKRRGAAW
ncbi:ATP synthase subunit I [Stakelama sp. CBK3Z-3]|uniref:ATP synthase subunit I n=1 Tax=Stakelama flava TaxID=2860338 RepID=A0ABS6XJ57_9SPHN|nr:ATP synthase subunit I [Stakelama flava]MBW4330227.1 ATP synthase subunit I [Stakelama flava]